MTSPERKRLDYESSAPFAHRAVRIPRLVFVFHKLLISSVDAVTVVYGVTVMSVSWVLKQLGFVFLAPVPKKRKTKGDKAIER